MDHGSSHPIAYGQHISLAAIAEQAMDIFAAQPNMTRYSLAKAVCRRLDWRDPGGRLRDMACRVALLKLQRHGEIVLPAPRRPRITAVPLKPYERPELECNLATLGLVELVLVDKKSRELSQLWRRVMQHHYLADGPLCGAQLRYLVKSEKHGWLGGLAFSGAARRVAARDQWIGWTDTTREEKLFLVANNSRFLILPQVRVKHLASHILGKACRRLANDWESRYGYRPVLLETFVERDRFAGTSYCAANWQYIGSTRGRGRQDRKNTAQKPVKEMYVYPLHRGFRKILGGNAPPVPSLDWTEEEFGRVELMDARLNKRLQILAADFFNQPQANIPQACGSTAKAKAAYRFFDHSETSMDTLLASHYQSTAIRMKEHPVVLAAQDTTSLNYNTHPATNGLGPVCAKGTLGLLLHDTMAFSVDGVPLGLLDVQCWARPEGKKEKKKTGDPGESVKWLKSFKATADARALCPKTTVVSVGDREADIYELFALAGEHPGTELLVRAKHQRRLMGQDKYLWLEVMRLPEAGIQEVFVPRQGKRAARTARLAIRFSAVTLKPPQQHKALGPITLWAVLATETNPPEDTEPLEWLLLTTLEIKDFEGACEKLAWYTKRWGIEVYHRTLKSGCKIEDRQLGNADRIESCLAIDMVVAWRVYHLTKLGRETPDVPCTVFFEEHEWKALAVYSTRNPVPPEIPPTLNEAMRMVARIGGFLDRKSDGNPGTQTIWLGLQALTGIAAMWRIMNQPHAPP